ncbi:MAG: winged helix-turn-helix transcriptional regulator [Candidatus Hodarchaeales archaeon]
MQTERENRCVEKGDKIICFYPLEGIINIISKKCALVLIGTIGNQRVIRFNELQKKNAGISSKTLADRLKEQEKAGLIKREVFAEIPPRVEYFLTQDGIEVRNTMLPLMEWA